MYLFDEPQRWDSRLTQPQFCPTNRVHLKGSCLTSVGYSMPMAEVQGQEESYTKALLKSPPRRAMMHRSGVLVGSQEPLSQISKMVLATGHSGPPQPPTARLNHRLFHCSNCTRCSGLENSVAEFASRNH